MTKQKPGTDEVRSEIEREFERLRKDADDRRRKMEAEFEERSSSLTKGFPEPTKTWDEEVKDAGKEYRVSIKAAGLDKNAIDVNVTGRILTVEAKSDKTESRDEDGRKVREHRAVHVSRSYTLPGETEADKVSASYKDDTISIVLPKKKQ